MKPRPPYVPLFLVAPREDSPLWYEPEETVEQYPGLHEVIGAVTGARAPKKSKDLFRPTVTDRCRESGRGDTPTDQVCRAFCDFYARQYEKAFAVRGVRGNLAEASLVEVTHTTIVMKVAPVWALLPRMDNSHSGVYEFDRLSGESLEGHRIPDMYLSRIEMYYADRV